MVQEVFNTQLPVRTDRQQARTRFVCFFPIYRFSPSTVLDQNCNHASQEETEEDDVNVVLIGVRIQDESVQGAHEL